MFLLIPLLAGDDDSPYMFDHGDNGTSEHLHPLLHVLVVVWVLQFSSLAHVKLTYLTVLVNLLDTGMEHHQGSLRLFPVKNVGLLTPEIYTALCPELSDSIGHVVSVDTPIGFALSDWH